MTEIFYTSSYSSEAGGRDFAKRFIIGWLYKTGGSNIRLLEQAIGLPVNILEVLLNELIAEGKINYEKCYRGVKIWRVIY